MPKVSISFILAAIVMVGATETISAPKNPYGPMNEQSESQGGTFSLAPMTDNSKRYSLAISDDNERSISGSFTVDQLQILRAIMVEAEKFGLTSESVNQKEPMTTRFMDKQEPAFIVDVQKNANQSLLFLTLKTEIGRMTWEAGRIYRSTRREEGFFFDLLTKLESILPKLPGPSSPR